MSFLRDQKRLVTGAIVAAVVIALVGTISLVGLPKLSGATGSKVVATVNGDKITKDQLYQKMVQKNGDSVLQQMITMKLLEQEAKKKGITVTDQDIQNERQFLVDQLGGEQQFQQMLSQYGMSEQDLQEQLKMQVYAEKLIGPSIKITTKDEQNYFNQNKSRFGTPEKVQASHILVNDKATADKIEQQLKNGAKFADLAKKYSQDKATADKGGDLGWFKKGDMVQAFSDAAFKLKVGQISQPVKTQYGYHIIKVTGHKDAKPAKFSDVQSKIHRILLSQKVNSKFTAYIQGLRQKANITDTLANQNQAQVPTAPSSQGSSSSASSSSSSSSSQSSGSTGN